MINIVSAQYLASKLLQQVILFVGRAIRSDYADCTSTSSIANLRQSLARIIQRLFPAHRRQLAVCLAYQRLRQAILMVGKVKRVAPLDAEKVAVDSALVAIVP